MMGTRFTTSQQFFINVQHNTKKNERGEWINDEVFTTR